MRVGGRVEGEEDGEEEEVEVERKRWGRQVVENGGELRIR